MGAAVWVQQAVTASTMITRFNSGRKVRCHTSLVEKRTLHEEEKQWSVVSEKTGS